MNCERSEAPSAALPLAVANAVGRAIHDPHSQAPKGEIPLGLPLKRKTFHQLKKETRRTKPKPITVHGNAGVPDMRGYDRDEEFG